MVAIILTETLTCFKNLYFKYTSLILISQIAWHFCYNVAYSCTDLGEP